jgi:hypothetical protein
VPVLGIVSPSYAPPIYINPDAEIRPPPHVTLMIVSPIWGGGTIGLPHSGWRSPIAIIAR